jgi:hydroxyacylglutathione hydrolase
VLDVRSFDTYAEGHIPGALNVPAFGHSFATKAGSVLSAPPVVHASTRAEAERAIRGLRSVGFLELAGVIVDPVAEAAATLAPVGLDELAALLDADAVELVDVREADERAETPLPGSHHLSYRLAGEGAGTLPPDRLLVTVCESGPRAAVAASILAAHGLDVRPLVHAGVPELRARQLVPASHIRREDVSHA